MVSTTHVIPAGDVVEHEETEGCVCGPLLELHTFTVPVEAYGMHLGDVQATGVVVVHHSLDDREQHEGV